MDWDDIRVMILGIAAIIALLTFLSWLSETSRLETEQKCQQQFGKDWFGKYEYYGQNFCANRNGEVKYPL